MAFVDVYVDPSRNANVGSGSLGNPWGDLQHALNNQFPYTSGVNMHIKSGVHEVLYKPLDFSVYGLTTNLRICGYTTTKFDGGMAEINCNGFSCVDNTGFRHRDFLNLKIGKSSSSSIFNIGERNSIVNCDIHTTSAQNIVASGYGTTIIGTTIRNWTYGGSGGTAIYLDYAPFVQGAMGQVFKCFIHMGSVSGRAIRYNNKLSVHKSIIHANNADAVGVVSIGGGAQIWENSFFNEIAGSSVGISFDANCSGSSVIGNIFEGWGDPISGAATNKRILACVKNYYYNNSNNDATWGGVDPVEESGNVIPSQSLFTDPVNDNFVGTEEAREGALVQEFRGLSGQSHNYDDAGACQLDTPIGGGPISWGAS